MDPHRYKWMLDTLMRDFTALGGFLLISGIVLSVLLLQQKELFYFLLFGYFFIHFLGAGIKALHFKPRPNHQTYHNLIEKIDAGAFPSVHTARTFFFSLGLAYFFQNFAMTILLLLTAIIVSYSRVYLKKHDWWDLLGGLMLALLTFWLAFNFFAF